MITRDMELVVIFGRLALIVAAITVTSFPILYLFTPWYKRPLGRAIMLQSLTLVLAIWLKFILTFFFKEGPRDFLLWTNDIVLVSISVASSSLTYILWKIRQNAKSKEQEIVDDRVPYYD